MLVRRSNAEQSVSVAATTVIDREGCRCIARRAVLWCVGEVMRRWVLLVVGIVLVLGAFGVFSVLGIGRSSKELCVGNSHMAVESATRTWLPVVRSLCTYAPSYDQRVVQVVFDVPASAVAVGGWVLIGASFYSRRRPKPQCEPGPPMPIERGS